MKCNNQYCYWNAFESCVVESEEKYNAATPNELDCPSSLRKDFEESMWFLRDEIDKMTYKRNFRELCEIYKFVKNQRKDEANV